MRKIILYICAICAFGYVANAQEIQWADEVVSFTSEQSPLEGAARNILGTPSVMPNFGYSSAAWMPKSVFGRPFESIVVKFRTPSRANQVVINENYFSGLITSITLFDEEDNPQVVYENKTPRLSNSGNLFHCAFKKTKFDVFKLEIKVNASLAYKGMQLDAVGIMLSDKRYEIQINEISKEKSIGTEAPINLGSAINSKYYELMPIISQDGSKLYFTRERHPENIGDKKAQDIWFSKIDSTGNFVDAINIGAPLNNEYHNFALSLSTDGNSMFVGNVYKPDGTMAPGLSITKRNGSSWGMPVQVLRELELRNNQVNYFLAPNGKVIITSANLNNDGFGENDLYAVFRTSDSTWSRPINLGSGVNTPGMDITPFLAADMTTLYFATNARPGYGDFDIFMTRRLDDTWQNWSEPVNLGQSFNTPGWDAYLTIPASGDYAYFTSSNNSIGASDIFKIKLSDELKPKVVTLISGKVFNATDNSPVEAKIVYEILNKNLEAGIATSNPTTGEYQIALPAGELYGYLAEADGYLSQTQNIDLTDETYFRNINRDLFLVPVKKGANITINNLFFEFGKFDLLPASFPELDRLAAFMLKDTRYNVLISGHTDDVGSDATNNILSKNRADAVARYLIIKGVDKKRLKVKGFGKSKPIKVNDTEENRQLNRRVEFELL